MRRAIGVCTEQQGAMRLPRDGGPGATLWDMASHLAMHWCEAIRRSATRRVDVMQRICEKPYRGELVRSETRGQVQPNTTAFCRQK